MTNLNSVETKFKIDGKQYHFVDLKLEQAFNKHHICEVRVDFEQLDSVWMENPTKIIKLIGQDLSIEMKHLQTGETNLFQGIVTHVSMNGNNGEKNYITITGASPTIKLEDTPTMNSFSDLTLDLIAKEAIENSGNAADVTINTKYKSTIDYIAQYNENCFQFLNRLSWLYGEWLFFDGTTAYFGKPQLDDAIQITYDEEITHFELSANLVPANVNRYEYLNHQDNEATSATPYRVDGVRGYIKASLDRSEEIYTSDALLPLHASIGSKKDLDDLILVDKYRRVSQMLTFKATSKTCKVKLGRLLSVNLPGSMRTTLKHVETFLVTQVIHEAHQDGSYTNSFMGIPSEMEHIPMDEVKAPVALSQIAWVTSNADDRGRVKVEFQWQKKLNKTTNWIRVQTPDGGSSDVVSSNRGFVFIPEQGDQVMINFENGDPNRPYVSGSIFKESRSKGGLDDNHIKSIKTRSGIEIVFNDDQRSLHIQDPSGNTWDMDGNGNINVTAPHQITFNSENILFNASKDVTTNAGNSVGIRATNQIYTNTETMSQFVNGQWALQANTSLLNTLNRLNIESPNMVLASTQNLVLHSDDKMFANSMNSIQMRATNSIQSSQESVQHEYAQQIDACVVDFRPSADFDAQYGFDWFRVGDIGDMPFESILVMANILDGNTNRVSSLTGTQALEALKRREYRESFPIAGTDQYYYVPTLNFYTQGALAQFAHLPEGQRPVNVAKFRIFVTINRPIAYIQFTYDKSKFQVTPEILTDNQSCRKRLTQSGPVTVTCIDPGSGFSQADHITAWAMFADNTPPQLVGNLKVSPNAPQFRKKHKVLILSVATNINGSSIIPNRGQYNENEINNIYKYLYQSFIEADIEIYHDVLDLTDDENFIIRRDQYDPRKDQYGKFIYQKSRDLLPPGKTPNEVRDGYIYHDRMENGKSAIYPYLRNKFFKNKANKDRYIGHTIIYIFDERSFIYKEETVRLPDGSDFDDMTTIGGQTEGHWKKNIILFETKDNTTMAHELLHDMGLTHTFLKAAVWNNMYMFLDYTTDNIMDYAPPSKIKHTYRWQWKIINEKLR